MPITLSRKVIVRLGFIGILFLFIVHVYLFHILMENESLLLDEFGHMVNNNNDFKRELTPLRDNIDYEFYTVRINTWKRFELLKVAITHYSTCSGVAEIQVVWCTDQGKAPTEEELLADIVTTNSTRTTKIKLTIEEHDKNSLNERFHILSKTTTTPTTLGILSVDDDVIRPCYAIDNGFFKWTRNPDRMVGFDARSHSISDDSNNKWSYVYLSMTERTNEYSITLPRYSFIHRDYLDWYYTSNIMSPIREIVRLKKNCEDIAMSFMVSYYTKGRPPLLADYWASRMTQIKLYVADSISSSGHHKSTRDACVDDFATILNLKDKLKPSQYIHHHSSNNNNGEDDGTTTSFFRCGANENDDSDDENNIRQQTSINNHRHRFYIEMNKWLHKLSRDELKIAISNMKGEATKNAYEKGLITETSPWEKRFGRKKKEESGRISN